ncbi:hypothetical protein ACFQL1_00075 [Halomicroarcula sp. GCM10025709]|uniref:hypothetical protein n=1 Tax=Halomicroarcula sp. GCM10025709 TaxID=3252669 RepID=UPI00361B79A3
MVERAREFLRPVELAAVDDRERARLENVDQFVGSDRILLVRPLIASVPPSNGS